MTLRYIIPFCCIVIVSCAHVEAPGKPQKPSEAPHESMSESFVLPSAGEKTWWNYGTPEVWGVYYSVPAIDQIDDIADLKIISEILSAQQTFLKGTIIVTGIKKKVTNVVEYRIYAEEAPLGPAASVLLLDFRRDTDKLSLVGIQSMFVSRMRVVK